jgi:PAS domain S-box-containing protein
MHMGTAIMDMTTHLRILLIEDSPDDAALIEYELRKARFSFELLRVATRSEFLEALSSFQPDAILSDYSLPQFDAMTALELTRARRPFTPFVIVTGSRTEETAVECMKAGATDYVLKDHLSRIAPAIWSAREHKHAEMELRQNQEMFRLITQNVTDLIAVLDINGKRLYNSRSYENVLGESERLRGTDAFAEIHPDDRDRIRHIFDQTIRTGNGQRTEYRFLLKDGSIRYIESVGDVIRNEQGEVVHVLVVSRDVTEQKEVERQLRLLAYALTCTQDFVTLTDLDDRILFVNDAFLAANGYTQEELAGRLIATVRSAPGGPGILRQIHEATLQLGGWSGEIFSRRKDETEFPVELWSSIVLNHENDPIAMVGIARDITQRRQAEEALRASEEKYRQFFEEDLTGDFISTPDGRLLSCNPAFVRMFGFSSAEEALTTNVATLYPDAPARERFLDLLRRRRKLDYHEVELRQKDGSPLYVIENAIGNFDESGNLVEIKGYLFDNTERRRLEEQLIQSQKMEAVGQLAGGVAHEFNNIMTVILTAAETLKSKTTEQNTLRLARMIESSTLRGSAIAKQLLQFSRAETPSLVPTSIPQVVSDVWKILERSFPASVIIDVKTSISQGYILGDSALLQQMLLNICYNARDAMDPGTGDAMAEGTLTISLEYATGEFVERKFGEMEAERYVVLCVQDTGRGMTDDVRRRMFEPFFTTKDVGKGTGLGLSIVHGVVRSHHGVVDVESGSGSGTSVIIYFPMLHHTPAQSPTTSEVSATGHGENILVVEDEEDVRSLLMEWLSDAGYVPMEAANGAEALDVVKRNNGIHLVLADIGLPKMDGTQLYSELRKIRPDLPVVFCTGFIDDDRHSQLIETGARAVIQKPYRISDVLHTIHASLEG